MPPGEKKCGHEYILGDVAYTCERPPHSVDGYGPAFRHACGIDTGFARRTDDGDGRGPADLVTWGESGNGDGQDWDVAWGAIAAYGQRLAGGAEQAP